MLIAIDRIRENGDVRHIPVDKALDEGLIASITAQGVLTPILVTPDGDTGDYIVKAGRRRLRCARAAGFDTIPAEVVKLDGAWATAAALAENMVRAALHPLDQWRGIRRLIEEDMSIEQATTAIGLDERQARRMERLGQLHPAIQALIERYNSIPPDGYLRTIATAPGEMQMNAARAKNVISEWGGKVNVDWHLVAEACIVRRFPRGYAIFDQDLLPWDQDWLAQPGAPDEWTTEDRDTFLRFQREALEAFKTTMEAKKKRVEYVDFIGYSAKLPKGFDYHAMGALDVSSPPKMGRHDVLFLGIREDIGEARYAVATDLAAAREAERKKAEKAKGGTTLITGAPAKDAPAGSDDDAGEGADVAPTPIEAPDKRPLTNAGLEQVHQAKTRALKATLRDGLAEIAPETLLALTVLAFTADNVSVHGVDRMSGPAFKFRDLVSRILLPGGSMSDLSMADARGIVGEALARMLTVGKTQNSYSMRSGVAAEWIGAAIGADAAVGRFDTAEFLATVNGDELRRAAETIGEKTGGTVKDLRARLVGKLPDWRPAAAAFGAPAPAIEEEPARPEAEDWDDC